MFEYAVKNKINLTRDNKKSDFYIAFGISKAYISSRSFNYIYFRK